MTSQQAFRDNSKPLTNHKASILDAYVAAHSPERVDGYLDAVQDMVQYIEDNVLSTEEPNRRYSNTPSRVRTKLKEFCSFCKELNVTASGQNHSVIIPTDLTPE
ncbi:hypothetical protein GCM10027185_48980 [Spirosoma pulveris]